MTDDECLQRYGLEPAPESVTAIRQLLVAETEKERQSRGGDGELMKLNCVQLFALGDPADALLIWRAKQSSFDKACYIDVQLLCGAGLSETKACLSDLGTDESKAALARIHECEESGDFDEFTPAATLDFYRRYFGV